MILFQQKFIIAVDSMEEIEEKGLELQKEHPGSIICDVKKKIVKTKEMEYARGEITLQFVSEKVYKKTGLIEND